MQIIKYLFLLLLLSIVSISIYILTLDTKFDITTSYTVDIKKVYVKNYFNDIKNWKNISYFQQKDTLQNITLKLDSTSVNLSLFSVYLENDNIGKVAFNYNDTINNSTKIKANFYGEVTFIDKIYIFLKGISPGFYFDKIFTTVNEQMQQQLKNDFSYNFFAPIKVVSIPKTYYYKSRFTNPNISRVEIVKAYHQVKNQIEQRYIANNSFFIEFLVDKTNRKEYFIGIPITQKLTKNLSNDIFLDSLQSDQVLKTSYTGDIQFEKKYLETVKKQVNQQELNVNFDKKINVWNDHLKNSNPKSWSFETWYYLMPEAKKYNSIKTDTISKNTI